MKIYTKGFWLLIPGYEYHIQVTKSREIAVFSKGWVINFKKWLPAEYAVCKDHLDAYAFSDCLLRIKASNTIESIKTHAWWFNKNKWRFPLNMAKVMRDQINTKAGILENFSIA